MKKPFLDTVTGKDNMTLDFVRILALCGVAVGLGLQVYCVITGKPFSLQDFGIGLGSALAGAGAALKLKETTEPDVSTQSTGTTTSSGSPGHSTVSTTLTEGPTP